MSKVKCHKNKSSFPPSKQQKSEKNKDSSASFGVDRLNPVVGMEVKNSEETLETALQEVRVHIDNSAHRGVNRYLRNTFDKFGLGQAALGQSSEVKCYIKILSR